MKTVCGTIFTSTKNHLCSCEIEIDCPTNAEAEQNMSRIDIPCRHSGPHRGKPIKAE
jgi:hypothetical protein